MSSVKLTKNSLRSEKKRLTQLERYLPTLQLKKAMLQVEVNGVRAEIQKLEESFHETRLGVSHHSGLLAEHTGRDFTQSAKVQEIQKSYENIAGVEIPLYEGVTFAPFDYALFETPPWFDSMVAMLRKLVEAKARLVVAEQKKKALEKELREVSIRVNLFEKNLIPRAITNIKKIKVFLGDQELAAVGQAKVAKSKIEARKRLRKEKEDDAR